MLPVSCVQAVKIQIIQTLSMMISNTQNETSVLSSTLVLVRNRALQVYFILSNNRVNELIQHDFDFSDIDYISYYISFVKALSLKLNNVTHHQSPRPLSTVRHRTLSSSSSIIRSSVSFSTLKQ